MRLSLSNITVLKVEIRFVSYFLMGRKLPYLLSNQTESGLDIGHGNTVIMNFVFKTNLRLIFLYKRLISQKEFLIFYFR